MLFVQNVIMIKKKTLNSRKYPKCEQRIYVFYKGDTSKIKDLYPNVGRL